MRVLLVKTSSLGDVIHTLPALTDAAEHIPGIEFDWVIEQAFSQVPHWHPAVRKVITVALRRWRKHPWQTWRSERWAACKKELSTGRYDLVIDAQGLLKSALLTRYPKGPVAGYDRASVREQWASWFYRHRYSVPVEQHAVERIRQLFAQALGYPVPSTLGSYGLNLVAFTAQTAATAPYLVFLHGTTWRSKLWPEAQWRALAQLCVQQGWTVRLPWSTPGENVRATSIAKNISNAEVLPPLSLADLGKVIAGAKGCIAVDTGLGHLAAALNVPTVSLYGPTSPGKVGAYGKDQVHLCATGPLAGKRDKRRSCFEGLEAPQVYAALTDLLRAPRDS